MLLCVSLASDTPTKHHFPAISEGLAPFVSQYPFLQHPSFCYAFSFSSLFWLVFFFFFGFIPSSYLSYFSCDAPCGCASLSASSDSSSFFSSSPSCLSSYSGGLPLLVVVLVVFIVVVLLFLHFPLLLLLLVLLLLLPLLLLLLLLLLFLLLLLLLLFLCLSSLSSGSDSLMHVFLALPRCLASWAACCGGSVFCVSSVFGHPTGACIFPREKCRPQKGASLFFALCFPAFRGGVTEEAHYLGR